MYFFDVTNFNDPAINSYWYGKVEDIRPGCQPTLGRTVLTYRDLGIAQISVTIWGNNDQQAIVSASGSYTIGTNLASKKLVSQFLDLTLSAMNLQWSVFRAAGAGQVSIAKIYLAGRVETTKLA
jgi:hypothetical protein